LQLLPSYSGIHLFYDVLSAKDRIINAVGHSVFSPDYLLGCFIFKCEIVKSLLALIGMAEHDCSELVDRIDSILGDEMLIHSYFSDDIGIGFK